MRFVDQHPRYVSGDPGFSFLFIEPKSELGPSGPDSILPYGVGYGHTWVSFKPEFDLVCA